MTSTTPTEPEALAACPFCGETEKIGCAWTRIDAETTWWSAECHGCGLQILPLHSEAESIAAWNRRAPAAEPVGLRALDDQTFAKMVAQVRYAAKIINDPDEGQDAETVAENAVARIFRLATPARTDDAGVGGLRELIAYNIIQGSGGIRAAEHAKDFQTSNWSDALRSADAVLAALSPAPDRGEGEA